MRRRKPNLRLLVDLAESLVISHDDLKDRDPVEHPSHYLAGGLEVIDVIEAFGLNYRLGNVAKYILRAGRKDSTKRLEDLRKALWYLQREIDKA